MTSKWTPVIPSLWTARAASLRTWSDAVWEHWPPAAFVEGLVLLCRYLVVRSDAHFTQTVATAAVGGLLATVPALRQDGPMSWRGLEAISGVQVLLSRCDSAGNYAYDPTWPAPESVNRLELVCSCDYPERDSAWEDLAGRIAEFLGWEVADDETDEILRPRS